MALDADAWSAIATGAGVVVSLGAALFAYLQARRAAESVRFAREAAEATKDQANTARDLLALERARQDQADRPQFAVSTEPPAPGRGPLTRITMTQGPPEVVVSINWSGTTFWFEPDGPRALDDFNEQHIHMVKNQSTALQATPHEQAEIVFGRLEIDAREVGGNGRQWTDVQVVDWRQLGADPERQ